MRRRGCGSGSGRSVVVGIGLPEAGEDRDIDRGGDEGHAQGGLTGRDPADHEGDEAELDEDGRGHGWGV
jgi:hypothetical protein